MTKNDLNKTLDSALSTTFRTSLILNQVDSRLDKLRLRSKTLDIEDNRHSDYVTRNDSLDLPSNNNLNVDIWLQDLRNIEKSCRGPDHFRANNTVFIHELSSEYDKTTEGTASAWKIISETPMSMTSNDSKLTSSSSNYSMDSVYSTRSTLSTFKSDSQNTHAWMVPSAGRDSNGSSMNNKPESRLSDSSVLAFKSSSFSLRGRVKSLGIRKRKKSVRESYGILTSLTAGNDEGKNTNGKTSQTRTSLPNLKAFDISPQKLHRIPIEFKPLKKSVVGTIAQPSGLEDSDDHYSNLEPTFSDAIPYSVPKQYPMQELHSSTPKIAGELIDIERLDLMQQHCTQDENCQNMEDTKSFATQELECNPFDKDTNLTLASVSWTANNVFEYYFDAKAEVNNKSKSDTRCPGYYEADHGTLSTDNTKKPRLLPVRFALGHPVCPVSCSNHSISSDDYHCDQYPLEIVRAYFKNE